MSEEARQPEMIAGGRLFNIFFCQVAGFLILKRTLSTLTLAQAVRLTVKE
jgi:hypothetical protein